MKQRAALDKVLEIARKPLKEDVAHLVRRLDEVVPAPGPFTLTLRVGVIYGMLIRDSVVAVGQINSIQQALNLATLEDSA